MRFGVKLINERIFPTNIVLAFVMKFIVVGTVFPFQPSK